MSKLSTLAGPCSNDVFACLNDDITKVPASLWSIRRRQLPLSAVQAKKDFSQLIQFFAGSTQNDDGDDGQNTVITNAPMLPFLLRCVQPFVAMDPVGFTVNGEAIAAPDLAPGIATPYFDGIVHGAVPPPGGPGPSGIPAFLEWGIATQKAAYNYLASYRFQMPLSGVFMLFDELGQDIGTTDSHNPWEGFSNSMSAVPEYVREVNDNCRTIGDPRTFIPATGQNLAAPGETAVLDGVPTPLVPSSYGGLISDGIFHGAYPAPGLLLLPGTPIYLNAMRDQSASIYHNALMKSVQNSATFTYDQGLLGSVGSVAAPSGYAQFVKFVGGKLSTGVTLRGANLTPFAVIVWYASLSGMFRNHYNITATRDIINNLAGSVSGLEDKMGGKPITEVKKSSLLRALAGMSDPSSMQYEVLGRLAGAPDIDKVEAALPTVGA
jgi:hypothetical protein